MYFDHVVFLSCQTHQQARAAHIQGPTIQLMHIRGPITIQTYEGPQGPGTMLLKSVTFPEIRGPLRPMQDLGGISDGGQLQEEGGSWSEFHKQVSDNFLCVSQGKKGVLKI